MSLPNAAALPSSTVEPISSTAERGDGSNIRKFVQPVHGRCLGPELERHQRAGRPIPPITVGSLTSMGVLRKKNADGTALPEFRWRAVRPVTGMSNPGRPAAGV
ncbi:hypothetical protein [Nocardia aurea]|uniref:Uncharacterized protein n=1 Tax=Nocardia aurea TaxID=2144174 RepID=A0ABV3FRS8_9NOCA